LVIARAALPLVFLINLAADAASAQAPPPRDRVPPPSPGTAVIKGRVIDAQTGNALARVRVRLQAPGNPIPVMTDETGAFTITGVPAGSVSLWVERTGYMAMTYPEPRKTLRSSIRQLTIEDGQLLEGLKVPLYRGGAISGHVVDAHGEPAESVTVQVYRVTASGRTRPQQRLGASTNDLGEFRLAHLEPGSYLLRVQGRNAMSGDDPSDVQSVPIYFPGVMAMDQAQPITIERGQTVSGIELTLLEASSSTVSGIVLDAKGQPVSQNTYLSARATTEFSDMVVGGTGIRPDGTFRMKLLPGEYVLEVQSTRMGVMGPPAPGDQQFGRARISVGSAPVTDVSIVLGPGGVMSGKILLEGDTQPPNFQQINVGFGPPPTGIGCRTDAGSINADGTFRLHGIVGTCIVRMMGNLGRWSVKAIIQGDADLRDRVLTFDPGQQLRDVQVVLTDKRTELNLKVSDEHSRPTREYVAIAFSTDKTRWNEMSPYIRIFVPRPPSQSQPAVPLRGSADLRPPPTSEQRDMIVGAPPGEYYVVAVNDIAADDTRDPAVLERLATAAVRVTLSHERTPIEVSLRRIDLR
jgi:hypothetical protein